jgi:hypothetical protein
MPDTATIQTAPSWSEVGQYSADALARAERNTRNYIRQVGSAGGAASSAFARGRFRNEAASIAANEATQRALDNERLKAAQYTNARRSVLDQRSDEERAHNWQRQLLREGWEVDDRGELVRRRERDWSNEAEDRARRQEREDRLAQYLADREADLNRARDRAFEYEAEDRSRRQAREDYLHEQELLRDPIQLRLLEQQAARGDQEAIARLISIVRGIGPNNATFGGQQGYGSALRDLLRRIGVEGLSSGGYAGGGVSGPFGYGAHLATQNLGSL